MKLKITTIFLTCLLISSNYINNVKAFGAIPNSEMLPSSTTLGKKLNAGKLKMYDEGDEGVKRFIDLFGQGMVVIDEDLPKELQPTLNDELAGTMQNTGIAPLALLGVVSNGLQVAQMLLQAFGRQYAEFLVGAWTNNGYKKYSAKTTCMHFPNVYWERLPLFLKYLKPVLKDMPKEYLKEIRFVGKFATRTKGKGISKQDLVWSSGKTGKASVVQFFMKNNVDRQAMDIIIIYTRTKFDLAPDVFAILQVTSRFFGLVKSESVRLVKKSAKLNEKRIQFLLDYNMLIALQRLGHFLSLERQIPKELDQATGGKDEAKLAESFDTFDDDNSVMKKWDLPSSLQSSSNIFENYLAPSQMKTHHYSQWRNHLPPSNSLKSQNSNYINTYANYDEDDDLGFGGIKKMGIRSRRLSARCMQYMRECSDACGNADMICLQQCWNCPPPPPVEETGPSDEELMCLNPSTVREKVNRKQCFERCKEEASSKTEKKECSNIWFGSASCQKSKKDCMQKECKSTDRDCKAKCKRDPCHCDKDPDSCYGEDGWRL